LKQVFQLARQVLYHLNLVSTPTLKEIGFEIGSCQLCLDWPPTWNPAACTSWAAVYHHAQLPPPCFLSNSSILLGSIKLPLPFWSFHKSFPSVHPFSFCIGNFY
jgi:hypothetical protein